MSGPASLPPPPRIFDQLPLAVRRLVSLPELAHAVLSTDESFPITVAIDHIDDYASMALKMSAAIKRECRRVYQRGADRRRSGRRRVPRGTAFIYVHFLFTCWWMSRVGVKAIRRSGSLPESIRPSLP
jgi:hypothetical protein